MTDCFEINLDCQRFKREDITVELLEDCNLIVVNTRKVNKDDNSIVARKFSKRMYPINLTQYDKDSLVFNFDENGMLKIQIFLKKTD